MAITRGQRGVKRWKGASSIGMLAAGFVRAGRSGDAAVAGSRRALPIPPAATP
jgi:hypothetical protein